MRDGDGDIRTYARDQATLERSAETIKAMAAQGTLPPSLRGTTVFHVAARKL